MPLAKPACRDGVAILYGEFEHDGIDLRPLFNEPIGVALAADHPLAAGAVVALEDFLRKPLADVPTRDQRWRDFWTGARHRGGHPARVGATVTSLDGLIEAVGAGLGVALTVAPAVEALGPGAGVVFRPVPGLEPLEFWVAHRSHDDREHVLAFAEAAARALGAT